MLLAAGRGSRLRPQTDHTPKGLIRVGDETLVGRHLRRLAESGFGEVVANVHWLREPLTQALESEAARLGLALHISVEERLLGTAGGLRRVRELLADEPFALISSDIWTDLPYDLLRERAAGLRAGACEALMVLVPPPLHRAPDCGLVPDGGGGGDGGGEGGEGVWAAGRVALREEAPSDGGPPQLTYSGLAVLHPSLLRSLPDNEGDPLELWPHLLRPAVEKGLVQGMLWRGHWADCGTHAALAHLRAQRERLR